jgi:hypothetical protein
VDDVVTVCFELFYDITAPARVNIYPDVDFLSSPAKSESEYPTICRESNLLYISMRFFEEPVN